MTRIQLFELIALGAIWGGSFLFSRLCVDQFGPVSLVAARIVIAAALLWPLLLPRERRGQLRGKWMAICVLGMINSAIPFTLLAYTTQHITAGFSSILNSTAALFAAVIGYMWLRDKLTTSKVAGLLIGFVGVVLLVWDKVSFKGEQSVLPVITGLTAGALYGLSLNFTKRYLSGVPPLLVASGSVCSAAVACLPLGLVFAPKVMPSWDAWIYALALGAICTALAYIIFYRLFAAIGPTKSMTVAYLIPLFGVLWGVVFLRERVSVQMIIGGAGILLGMALVTNLLTLRKKPA